ncbi:hypothetical protein A7U60_g3289 [Sanghuangporus baumii]|uniref:Uncharacterized protein n=1 Tax=Sanghuangporus baumii TaxID=108892 RepID=A0A9Q5ND76_SANBA|nr:hypothetical protein A7U60_g3289 [Sanghuangporus baumii]
MPALCHNQFDNNAITTELEQAWVGEGVPRAPAAAYPYEFETYSVVWYWSHDGKWYPALVLGQAKDTPDQLVSLLHQLSFPSFLTLTLYSFSPVLSLPKQTKKRKQGKESLPPETSHDNEYPEHKIWLGLIKGWNPRDRNEKMHVYLCPSRGNAKPDDAYTSLLLKLYKKIPDDDSQIQKMVDGFRNAIFLNM